jgi:AcrR family transcriptional regulator
MARSKSRAREADVVADEAMPDWKRKSIDRSLQAARGRAQQRTDRLVEAAMSLMQERGSVDFTVQDVVERARMSIRTFYNFFEGKDDLIVAVHATVMVDEVVPRLRKMCGAESDPVKKIRAFIDGIYELTSTSGPIPRALTIYHNRLAENRPEELERTFRPQLDLVTELVRDAATAGQIQLGNVGLEAAARLLHHTVLTAAHARVLDPDHGLRVTADELWAFCASGLGVQTTRLGRRGR